MSDERASAAKATVLVYSDDRTVREQVRLALGRRVAADLPEIEVGEGPPRRRPPPPRGPGWGPPPERRGPAKSPASIKPSPPAATNT